MGIDSRAEARARIRPFVDRARSFSGWNFGDMASERVGPPLPWNYEQRASELLTGAASVLDMGTGGGEVFGELVQVYRGRAVASEEWEVNAPIAAKRLSPLGVATVRSRSANLPFRSGVFELVLNRHEELDPLEVARVLAPRGRILIQQVGRNNWRELRRFFPRMSDFGPLFEKYIAGFQAAGLSIVQAERFDTQEAFRDVGQIAYMLCVAPWEIPDFSPLEHDLDALIEVDRTLRTGKGIVLTQSRFLIEAERTVG